MLANLDHSRCGPRLGVSFSQDTSKNTHRWQTAGPNPVADDDARDEPAAALQVCSVVFGAQEGGEGVYG